VTTCLLLSGGIDSMVVLSLLRKENRNTIALFVEYGQGALDQERIASHRLADHFDTKLITVRIEFPQRYGAGEIPYRNATLIFAAAMASAISRIVLRSASTDAFPISIVRRGLLLLFEPR
jgi:tRNA(Ile)-lysidine synthase TilS/MesJ